MTTLEFEQLVDRQVSPVLEPQGFLIHKESEFIIRFLSSKVEVRIVYNPKENSGLAEIGELGGPFFPLNDATVTGLFKSKGKVGRVPIDDFVRNVSRALATPVGLRVLAGNVSELSNFISAESAVYTNALINHQILDAASSAWQHGNLGEFIDLVNEIGLENCPRLLRARYEVAMKKANI
jgi:hypothetical protein